MVDHDAAVAFPMGDLRPHGVPGAVVAGLRKGIEELVAVLDKPFRRWRVAHDLSLVEQKRLRLEPLAHEHMAHDAYVFHSLADVGEHPAVLGGDERVRRDRDFQIGHRLPRLAVESFHAEVAARCPERAVAGDAVAGLVDLDHLAGQGLPRIGHGGLAGHDPARVRRVHGPAGQRKCGPVAAGSDHPELRVGKVRDRPELCHVKERTGGPRPAAAINEDLDVLEVGEVRRRLVA